MKIVTQELKLLILITYYKGAYGPTVKIDLSSKESLILMKNILQNLAIGSATECKFHELQSVKIIGLHEMHLRLIPEYKYKTVRIVVQKKDNPALYWTNNAEGWTQCVELLDGIGNIPSHQYLSIEGIDDALIEVSYLE